LWPIIGLPGAMLFLEVYPKSEKYRTLFLSLQAIGVITVAVMFAIFRRTTKDGGVAWIKTAYPEILGLIGFTYLVVSLMYLLTRRWRWASLAWFVALTAYCAICSAKWLTFQDRLPIYEWPFRNGASAALAMAGIATSIVFVGPTSLRWPTFRDKLKLALPFAAICLVMARVLTPLGISKIRATPTWVLYCVGAFVLIFALLYWICDVKKKTNWANFAKPAGSNTLLTYLLPDLWYFIISLLGVTWFETHYNAGMFGVIRTIIFTALMLLLAQMLTKAKIRLQL